MYSSKRFSTISNVLLEFTSMYMLDDVGIQKAFTPRNHEINSPQSQ